MLWNNHWTLATALFSNILWLLKLKLKSKLFPKNIGFGGSRLPRKIITIVMIMVLQQLSRSYFPQRWVARSNTWRNFLCSGRLPGGDQTNLISLVTVALCYPYHCTMGKFHSEFPSFPLVGSIHKRNFLAPILSVKKHHLHVFLFPPLHAIFLIFRFLGS